MEFSYLGSPIVAHPRVCQCSECLLNCIKAEQSQDILRIAPSSPQQPTTHITTLDMFNFVFISSVLALAGIAVAQEYSFYGQGLSIVLHAILRPFSCFL